MPMRRRMVCRSTGSSRTPPSRGKRARNSWTSFSVAFPVILDSAGDLALRLGPRVTSEAFVISTADRVVYRGRIDDRFAAVGRLRTRISSHDLRTVIEAMTDGGQPEPYATEPIGCFHHDWGQPGRERH